MLAVIGLAGACAPQSAPDSAPIADNVAWIKSTCAIEEPDTTGWRRHRFANLSIAVPPGYPVSNPNARSIQFRRGTGRLTLDIGTSVRNAGLYATPARPNNEASCYVTLAGFPAEIASTAYGHTFSVTAEWEGVHFWPPGDYRRRLRATISASRLHDATVLRQALQTLRLERDSLARYP